LHQAAAGELSQARRRETVRTIDAAKAGTRIFINTALLVSDA
jgi:hypothetical protein